MEETHFRLRSLRPYDIRRRALAVNLSDIAAMGARPRFALISLLVPPLLEVAVLDGIYAGLQAQAAQFHLAIVGGNIARNAERLILDLTLLETGTRGRLLRRDQTRAEDVVIVNCSNVLCRVAARLPAAMSIGCAPNCSLRDALASIHPSFREGRPGMHDTWAGVPLKRRLAGATHCVTYPAVRSAPRGATGHRPH